MHGVPRKAPTQEERDDSSLKAAKLRDLQSQLLHFHHNKMFVIFHCPAYFDLDWVAYCALTDSCSSTGFNLWVFSLQIYERGDWNQCKAVGIESWALHRLELPEARGWAHSWSTKGERSWFGVGLINFWWRIDTCKFLLTFCSFPVLDWLNWAFWEMLNVENIVTFCSSSWLNNWWVPHWVKSYK